MGKEQPEPEIVMGRVRTRFAQSGLSLHDLGLRMGYPAATARQSAWQFMKTADPRLSMLQRFARAMETTVEELIAENGTRKRKNGSPKK
jgi:transcriptional regulator with XRE-family HTH domain